MNKVKRMVLPLARRIFLWAGGEIAHRTTVQCDHNVKQLAAVYRIDERDFGWRHDIPRMVEIIDRELRARIGSEVGKAVTLDFVRDLERDPFALYRKATISIVEEK